MPACRHDYPSSFRAIACRPLPGLAATARIFAHASGLEVLSLECDDPENMFALGVPTRPDDDTGVAHILEHAVLAGSQRYPVKDPFMEMIKSSMATFINALTYNDYTAYPVASVVPADFFNLAAVYWDAVFAPRLSRDSFLQEGWRLELASPGDLQSPLVSNGIVLNEMRAAASDLDAVIGQETDAGLLPETPRARNAGGRPEAITALTYEAFLDFYRQHYHPARIKLFFYGNIPTADKLAFVAARLDDTPMADTPAPVPAAEALARPRQKRWPSPRRTRVAFAPALDQPSRGNRSAAWATAFFLSDQLDPVLNAGFDLLDYLLLGNAAAPLRKTILKSGLADNLLTSGYDNESPEAMFRLSLDGCDPKRFADIDRLVDDCLADIARQGFSQEQVDAAFRQYQLEQREIDQDHALNLMEDTFDAWCLGADPLLFLDRADTLDKVAQKLRTEPDWLNKLLVEHLLRNPHRLTLELIPDRRVALRRQQAEAAELARHKQRLAPAELAALDQAARELQQRQGLPNTPEDLATLPRLRRHDIPSEPCRLPVTVVGTPGGVPLLNVDTFSNGIAYFHLAFPLRDFPPATLSGLATFVYLFNRLGTATMPYDRVAERFAAASATVSASIETGFHPQAPDHTDAYLVFTLTSLAEYFPTALDLFRQRLTETVFIEQTRIGELLRQSWASTKKELLENGGAYAAFRAAAGLSPMHDLTETWFGITAARTSRRQALYFDAFAPQLTISCELLAERLRSIRPAAAAIVGGSQVATRAGEFLERLAATPAKTSDAKSSARLRPPKPAYGRRETVRITGDVGFCTRIFPAPHPFDPASPALNVYAHLLSCGYLWDEIRLKGGAYGVGCAHLSQQRCFLLNSLNDPDPGRTFAIFDHLGELHTTWTNDDIEAAIIATAKGDSVPIRPVKAGYVALWRHLFAMTDAIRAEYRQRLLNVTSDDVAAAAADLWQNNAGMANDCAIAPARLTAQLLFKTLTI